MSKFEEYLEAVKESVEKQSTVKLEEIEISSEKMTWDEAMAKAKEKGKRLLERTEMTLGEVKDNAAERESARGYGRKIVPAFFTKHVGKEFWSATQVKGTEQKDSEENIVGPPVRAYVMKVSKRPDKNIILNRGQKRNRQQTYDKMREASVLKTEMHFALFVKE